MAQESAFSDPVSPEMAGFSFMLCHGDDWPAAVLVMPISQVLQYKQTLQGTKQSVPQDTVQDIQMKFG
jgi:hypothetical protein